MTYIFTMLFMFIYCDEVRTRFIENNAGLDVCMFAVCLFLGYACATIWRTSYVGGIFRLIEGQRRLQRMAKQNKVMPYVEDDYKDARYNNMMNEI